MSANWLVRSQIKARIAELLTSASGVTVARAFPQTFPDELIWFASTTGELEYNVFGGNLPRDDKFQLVIVASCRKPGNDPAEAEDRAEEIASTVILTLGDNIRLDDDVSDEYSIFDALITSIDGPESDAQGDGEGFVAAVAMTVEIHLRITREQ